jgi:hypothetical protein
MLSVKPSTLAPTIDHKVAFGKFLSDVEMRTRVASDRKSTLSNYCRKRKRRGRLRVGLGYGQALRFRNTSLLAESRFVRITINLFQSHIVIVRGAWVETTLGDRAC